MEIINNKEFGGERPLYRREDLHLVDVVIHLGESSVKECHNIVADNCHFEGRYVFWENHGVRCHNCHFAPSARASVWYSRDIKMTNCNIDAPKMFRRAHGISLHKVTITNAEETFWDCSDIKLTDCDIRKADYLFMHCRNIDIEHYHQDGNYSFQYATDVTIRNAVINIIINIKRVRSECDGISFIKRRQFLMSVSLKSLDFPFFIFASYKYSLKFILYI